ncbi:MAG: redoxin family protein [Acidimicrobiia bacterium]
MTTGRGPRPALVGLIGWIGLVVAGWALVGCGGGPAAGADRTVAYDATSFADGRPVTLSALRGDAVLLASWATWCAPCERELPRLDELADARGADGLQVVAVNIDHAGMHPDDITAMLDRLGVEAGADLSVWRDPENRLGETFGGFGVPFAVLIDRDGRVVDRWNGALDPTGDHFVAALERALAP